MKLEDPLRETLDLPDPVSGIINAPQYLVHLPFYGVTWGTHRPNIVPREALNPDNFLLFRSRQRILSRAERILVRYLDGAYCPCSKKTLQDTI